MNSYQIIEVNGIKYYIIDSIQNFRAEDSFIHRQNKLLQFSGNGESKKYIGNYDGENGRKKSDFFDYSNWGVEYIDQNKKRKTYESAKMHNALISEKCFFSKSNLLKYLSDAKTEYFAQEQKYHNDISAKYPERLKRVSELSDEINFFSIYDASDNLTRKQNRGYIRSDDKVWALWRELVLPGISYLSILKIVKADDIKHQNPLFYFRILLDYQFRSIVHPSLEQNTNEAEEIIPNLITTKYRKGATDYRKKVIEHMPQCPFTKISDERLLIASHIKPYNICIKENKKNEAVDYLNGLSLAPTYDKLFDQGYITFSNEGELICGTQLSSYTWEKLNINPNAKNKMRIYPKDREEYLEYHRKNVFQG